MDEEPDLFDDLDEPELLEVSNDNAAADNDDDNDMDDDDNESDNAGSSSATSSPVFGSRLQSQSVPRSSTISTMPREQQSALGPRELVPGPSELGPRHVPDLSLIHI